MLSGNLIKNILIVALPISASAILQQLFNSADTAIVGRFAGSESLAAVGGNGFVISLMVSLFTGMAVGANVVMSNRIGRGDEEGISKTLHTTILFAAISGIVMSGIGLSMADIIHSWMGTGEEGSFLRQEAVSYFRVYFCGIPFILLYNFESALFRSKGDTRRPLIVLMIAGVLNVGLNILFVAGFGMTAAGVALATSISNAFSALTLMYFLVKEPGPFQLKASKLKMDKATVADIVRIGIPAGIQSSMFGLANVIMQSTVNSLGSTVIAGTTVGVNAEFFAFFTVNGFSQACTSFVGQNYGARNLQRCKKSTLTTLALGTVFCMGMSILFVILRYPIAYIFTGEAAVAELAAMRFIRVGLFQPINGISDMLSGSMRGMRKSLVPALITVIAICGVRLLWIFVIYPMNKTYEFLIVAYPASWVVCTTCMVTAYIIVMRRLKRKGIPDGR